MFALLEEETMENETVSKNFIEQEIDKDLAEGVYDHVATRFRLNRTVTCISDMQNQFCLITDWPRNMAAHLI